MPPHFLDISWFLHSIFCSRFAYTPWWYILHFDYWFLYFFLLQYYIRILHFFVDTIKSWTCCLAQIDCPPTVSKYFFCFLLALSQKTLITLFFKICWWFLIWNYWNFPFSNLITYNWRRFWPDILFYYCLCFLF